MNALMKKKIFNSKLNVFILYIKNLHLSICSLHTLDKQDIIKWQDLYVFFQQIIVLYVSI